MVYTERQAIQDELRSINLSIEDQRRDIQSLRDRKMDLLKRLRDLDERDLNDDISYDALASLTESLKECIDKLSSLVPNVSVLDVIKHIEGSVNPEQIIVSADKVNKSQNEPSSSQESLSAGPRIIEEPKPEIEVRVKKAAKEQKERMPNNPKMSTERAASVIKEILEDRGTAKVKEIEKEFFRRTGSKYVNFYEKMARASEIYPNIYKIGMGKWGIKRPELSAVNS